MPCLCECIPTLGQAIFTLVAFFGLKFAYGLYKCSKSSGKKTPKILKEDWKKDVVYLYQFPRPDYTAQLSPFCLKVEAFLRLHDIKHEVVETMTGRSKEGLLPFIELNGEQIADSQLILLHLKKVFNIQDNLTDEQKSVERAFDRLIEGSFFNAITWLKVKGHEREFAKELISLALGRNFEFLAHIFKPMFAAKAKKRFSIEGTAKHSDEEILTILRSDLKALETYLGEKEYFFGDEPSQIDIEIFAHFGSVYYLPYRHLAKDMVESEFPKIVKHTEKISKKFFSDFKFVP